MRIIRVVKAISMYWLNKRINSDILFALSELKKGCKERHEKSEGCYGCVCCETGTGICIASAPGIMPMEMDLKVIKTGKWVLGDADTEYDPEEEEVYEEEEESEHELYLDDCDPDEDDEDRGVIVKGLKL